MNFKPRQLSLRGKRPRCPLNRERNGPHSRCDVLQQEKYLPRCPASSQDTTSALTVRENQEYFTRHNDCLQWPRNREVKRFKLLKAFIVFIRFTSFHDRSDPVPQRLQPYCKHNFVTQRYIENALIVKPNNRN